MRKTGSFYLILILAVITLLMYSCRSKSPSPITAPHITESSTGTLKTVINEAPYPYYLHIPAEYDKHEYKYPLLVFLHGAGELSDSLDPVALRNGPLNKLYEKSTGKIDKSQLSKLNLYLKSSFILVPQSSLVISWKKPIKPLIDYIVDNYPVDKNRIYLTGLSLGGGATWNFAAQNPELYKAIVPVCGYASFPGMEVLKDMPIWAFHAFDDKLVSIEYTTVPILQTILGIENIMKKYPYANGNPENAADNDLTISFDAGGKKKWLLPAENKPGLVNFTLYKSGGHDSWTRAYQNDKMWKWLYLQKK